VQDRHLSFAIPALRQWPAVVRITARAQFRPHPAHHPAAIGIVEAGNSQWSFASNSSPSIAAQNCACSRVSDTPAKAPTIRHALAHIAVRDPAEAARAGAFSTTSRKAIGNACDACAIHEAVSILSSVVFRSSQLRGSAAGSSRVGPLRRARLTVPEHSPRWKRITPYIRRRGPGRRACLRMFLRALATDIAIRGKVAGLEGRIRRHGFGVIFRRPKSCGRPLSWNRRIESRQSIDAASFLPPAPLVSQRCLESPATQDRRSRASPAPCDCFHVFRPTCFRQTPIRTGRSLSAKANGIPLKINSSSID